MLSAKLLKSLSLFELSLKWKQDRCRGPVITGSFEKRAPGLFVTLRLPSKGEAIQQ